MSTKENFLTALKQLTGFEDEQAGAAETPEAKSREAVSKVQIEPIHMQMEGPEIPSGDFNSNMNVSFSDLQKEDFGAKAETGRTSIPTGMKVVGDIESIDRIEMMGKVEGSISTTGDVIVTGTVIGDVDAGNMLLQSSAIKGNVNANGDVTIEKDAKIVGNIKAENIHLDGRVKGNLKIAEVAELAAGALVLGDIETGFISTSRGTRIRGNIITKQVDDYGEDDFDIEV